MEPARSEAAVLVLVAVVLLVSGPVGGVSFASPSPSLDDGDASLAVLSPGEADAPLMLRPGRFGTDVAYLELPDMVADVRSVTGSPEVVYEVHVPEIGVEKRVRQVITSDFEGRLRYEVDDRGLPRHVLDTDSYEGRVVVRVQSFSTSRTVVNRTVTVVTER